MLGLVLRRGAGVNGSDRVTLTWPAAIAVKNGWLQVTVKANADTGLSAPDTFYVGNLVGETADTSTPRVNAIDVTETRAALGKPALITSRFDFDRNGVVNATDMKYVRSNQLARLYQFAAPAPAAASVPVAARAGPTRRGTLDGVTAAVLREQR